MQGLAYTLKDTGILVTAEALQQGYSKEKLYKYIYEQNLEKIGRGVYQVREGWVDELYSLQQCFPKAIYSFETALYLHDLTDREPMPFTVSVPSSYNAPALLQRAKVYYTKEPLLGVMQVKSPDGNMLRCYDLERTMCDILRKRQLIDPAVFSHAFKAYVKHRERNLNNLMKYARVFRVEGKMRMLMEVLL